MKLEIIPYSSPDHNQHSFSDHPEFYHTVCASKFLSQCTDPNDQHINRLHINCYLSSGNLPFLFCLLSLLSIRACLSSKLNNLGFKVGSKYIRIPLTQHNSLLHHTFPSIIKRSQLENAPNLSGSGATRLFHTSIQLLPLTTNQII